MSDPEVAGLREALRALVAVLEKEKYHATYPTTKSRCPKCLDALVVAKDALRDRAGVPPPPHDRAALGDVAAGSEATVSAERRNELVAEWTRLLGAASPAPWSPGQRNLGKDEMIAYLINCVECSPLHELHLVWMQDAEADICQTGNGTASEANAALIAWMRNHAEEIVAALESHARAEGARPAPVPLARAPLELAKALAWHDGHFPGCVTCKAIVARVAEALGAASPASRSSGPTDPDRAGSGDIAAKAEDE